MSIALFVLYYLPSLEEFGHIKVLLYVTVEWTTIHAENGWRESAVSKSTMSNGTNFNSTKYFIDKVERDTGL
ncbi:hypothetical protein PENTCL1PPCAC_16371 [Pristionchus entomophagus]|uniref:Uncharacterized protein n=1 Tax=Pristionchus entomophagus TaxID=358040 RepID=A0AAV5TIR6_9BILA|nr:hypothetical protein PENTCL1PPCAC_16371 [Pristionchus entomophagus]